MGDPMPSVKAKAAKIPTRRESTRTVKKPNRDLPEEPQVVGNIKVNETNDFCIYTGSLLFVKQFHSWFRRVCSFYAVCWVFFQNIYIVTGAQV